MAATAFVGISIAEVDAGGTGLFEFATEHGVPVRLHDAGLETLAYDLTRGRPQLRFSFRYSDGWVPSEAAEYPVVELTFEDVVISAWVDETEADDPPHYLRQVFSFDYRKPCSFDFIGQAFRVIFTARKASLTLTTGASAEG